ncbi:antitoxin [Alkalitalea saponilacus]|nr:HepT-like ribonuclease domain-containing protein [Alkalitalea saponilacus]ASB50290.1 antitoxin [Alkalitalea saponilacus]ASB50355.1 antitoxin [Alkalitalea saponilacus]ASB50359.1 antitoxin [Alkalitalea saponilacus]ASB50423.1 antitoxin [Alkalitalea saponilacus]ASB50439.1 antitoxin [Alkalitalea saponilacus]
MEKEVQTWLEDIRQSIDEIEEFLPEKRDFFEFKKDLKTRKAIERNIEIIGEAVHRILKVNSQIQITNARKIVDTRNRIIHGYDSVSEDIIWSIVSNDLKKLRKEIANLLDE